MGIQINGNTDTIAAIDGALTVSGAELAGTSNINVAGIITASGLVVSAGSTSAPSISPSGDSNTGIFFPSPDTIAFAEGGLEALRINNIGYIGIGTASPTSKLQVFGNVGSGTSSGAAVFTSNASQADSTNLAAINVDTPLQTVSAFFGKNTSVLGLSANQFSTAVRFNGNDVKWGDIAYYPNQNGHGHFRFSLTDNFVATTPNAKVGVGSLFVDSSIGINITTPLAPLHLNSTANPAVVIGPSVSTRSSSDVGFAKTFFVYIDRQPSLPNWSNTTNRDNLFTDSLYVRTPVIDGVNNPAIVIAENGGQATGRNSLVFWNDDGNSGKGYLKARLYTQVGSSYNATAFFIDVADSSRNIQNRFTIDVNGNFSGSASNDISDQRLKENIQTISNPIEKIKALKGRTFEWQERASMSPGTKYGFIAQEVEEVVPELILNESGIRVFDENDNLVEYPDLENGTTNYAKSVQSSGVIPILVEALKEALEKIETLEAEVAALKAAQ